MKTQTRVAVLPAIASTMVSLLLSSTTTVTSFSVHRSLARSPPHSYSTSSSSTTTTSTSTSTIILQDIVSPFSGGEDPTNMESSEGVATAEGPFELTWENVEMVLDQMRPYLIQDGGNVKIAEIDGPVVRLQLEGACGTCPSSTQTMKMGLERGLKEKIPEIQEVIQALPEGPPLEEDQINIVLDGVRPFLQVAGGSIDIDRIEGVNGLQPTVWLDMQGASASLNSVKLEIAQRLQRHFMMPGLRIEWKEAK